MFQLTPAPTMISPSMATKLFGTAEAGAPSLLAMKGMGDSIGNQIVNQELSTFGSDYYYNFYYLETETEQGDPRNYCVASTQVNPYLMIELEDHPGEPYAIFKPEDVSFNGDVIWTLHWHNSSIDCNLLIDEVYEDYPAALRSELSHSVRPNSGYFSIQRTDVGLPTDPPRLVWTKYIEDAYIPYGNQILQYPWDTLEWKTQHLSAISAWNDSHSWDEYVPTEPVYHGVTGAKYAYYTYVDPVDPMRYGFLNGPAMTFFPTGDGMGKMKTFKGYFFYPLLYLDSSGTGVLHKLNKDEYMPTFLSARYQADYSGIDAYNYYIDDEILSGPSTKKYGTPIWKLEFPDCPFPVDVDRNYFCAFVNDFSMLTVNITNTNQAWQAYCHRPTVKDRNVILWSEPKSNPGDGTPGKDVQVEDFLSVALERTKDFPGHSNWFRFTSCIFKSPSTGAIYKTDGIPHRGNGAIANEWVPDPVTPYKGGKVIMTWYRNSVFPITQYYLKNIDSFGTQPVLDGADMKFGIFQVLETRVNPNSN